jgi:hypothetical protein
MAPTRTPTTASLTAKANSCADKALDIYEDWKKLRAEFFDKYNQQANSLFVVCPVVAGDAKRRLDDLEAEATKWHGREAKYRGLAEKAGREEAARDEEEELAKREEDKARWERERQSVEVFG